MQQIGESEITPSAEVVDPSTAAPGPSRAQPQHKKLSLRKSFSWMFVAMAISSVLKWGMVIVLAKVGGAEMVGVWTLAMAICLPVMFLTGLNLESALVTDSRREFAIGQYLGLRLLSSVAMMAIIGFSAWAQVGDDWSTLSCVLLYGLGVAVLSVRTLVLSVAVQNECANVNARSELISSTGSLVALALLLWWSGSLLLALAGIMLFRAAVLLLHDLPVTHSVDRQFHPGQALQFMPRLSRGILRLAWVTLPLGIAVAALAYANNMPVYFLEAYHGTETTGYYGGLNAFILALNIFLVPLFSAVGPRLSRDFLDNRRRFVRLLLQVTGVFLAGGLIMLPMLYLSAPWLLRVALRQEYVAYSHEFVILMGMGVLYVVCQFLGFAIQASRGFWLLLVSQVIVLLASGASSWALVPSYGIWGAVWSRAVTVAIWVLVVVAALAWQLRRPRAVTAAA